jgi:dolichol-phosphate mannosyltransferase
MNRGVDIVIPVFNEGGSIRRVLDSLKVIEQPARILICYDFPEDDTLLALRDYDPTPLAIELVRNRGRGALGAVLSGFAASNAPWVLVFPADDDYNGPRLNALLQRAEEGYDIVAPSRFMPGGSMQGCPWLKSVLVRSSAFFLYHVARLPTRDASNGLRLFSRRVLETISIESTRGFAYSIELLVKTHRLGWRIAETPFIWHERKSGKSRFLTVRWLPQYLRWLCYALATTFLRRGPHTVKLRPQPTS